MSVERKLKPMIHELTECTIYHVLLQLTLSLPRCLKQITTNPSDRVTIIISSQLITISYFICHSICRPPFISVRNVTFTTLLASLSILSVSPYCPPSVVYTGNVSEDNISLLFLLSSCPTFTDGTTNCRIIISF